MVCVWMWSTANKQPRHLLWVGRRGQDYETKRIMLLQLILPRTLFNCNCEGIYRRRWIVFVVLQTKNGLVTQNKRCATVPTLTLLVIRQSCNTHVTFTAGSLRSCSKQQLGWQQAGSYKWGLINPFHLTNASSYGFEVRILSASSKFWAV
jgi:hypothetical protein